MSRFPGAAASVALGGALLAIALGARGGTELGRTTAVLIAATAAGSAIICLALLRAPSGRVHGGLATCLLAALTGLGLLSISWSIAPDLSYVEAGRSLAYLAVFAGAVAGAHLWPRSAPRVAVAVVLAVAGIVAYGLASRIWPGAFDEASLNGRLGLPFDYWNALAGAAAAGVAPLLWLASRSGGGAAGRILSFPLLGLCVTAILIAQSRGALAAAVVAAGLWLVLTPAWPRGLVAIAVCAGGALPVSAWALSQDAFVEYAQGQAAREAVAGEFGLLVLATIAGLTAAGWVFAVLAERVRLGPAARRGTAVACWIAVIAVPVGGLAIAASSDEGLTGTISDRYHDLVDEEQAPPVGGDRLGSVSSSRNAYWRQAWAAFEERPAVGLGAGSFEISRLAHRSNGLSATRAHGFLAQTLADLGLIGAGLALALLAAWLAAAARTTGLPRRRRSSGRPWSDERLALVALAIVAIAFGVQSIVDWTWFVPGLTVIALVAAGFVAGRGPLPVDGEGAAAGLGAATGSPGPGRALAAGGVAIAALLACWTIWQPESAHRATIRAYDLLDAERPAEALEEAERARERNPYALQPLQARAAILAAEGRLGDAEQALAAGVAQQPRNPEALLGLASFQLGTLDTPRDALRTAEAAVRIDPYSRFAADMRDQAAAALAAEVEAEAKAEAKRRSRRG